MVESDSAGVRTGEEQLDRVCAGAEGGKRACVTPVRSRSGRSECQGSGRHTVDEQRAGGHAAAGVPMPESQRFLTGGRARHGERHRTPDRRPSAEAPPSRPVPGRKGEVVRRVFGLDRRTVLRAAHELAAGDVAAVEPRIRLIVVAQRKCLTDKSVARCIGQEGLLLQGLLAGRYVRNPVVDVVVLIPVERVRPDVGEVGLVGELRHCDVVGVIRKVGVVEVLRLDADDVGAIGRHHSRQIADEAGPRERRPVGERNERPDAAVPQLHERLIAGARIAEAVRSALGETHELQADPIVAGQGEVEAHRSGGRDPAVRLSRHLGIRRGDAAFARSHVPERVARIARRHEHGSHAPTGSEILIEVGIEEEQIVIVVGDHVEHLLAAACRPAHLRSEHPRSRKDHRSDRHTRRHPPIQAATHACTEPADGALNDDSPRATTHNHGLYDTRLNTDAHFPRGI